MRKKRNNKLSVTLPTKWSELTATQVARVALCLNSGGDKTEQLIMLAADLSDLKPRGTAVRPDGELIYKFYHRDQGNVLLDAEHILALVEAISWVTSSVSLMQAPELDGCQTPDYRLYGVTVEQYITADTAYGHYVETRNVDALRMFAAALYPRNFYNSESLQKESKRIARLDAQLNGVLLWFTGTKKFLAEKYPYIFRSGDGGGDAPSGVEMLLSLMSSLNDGDVTKNDQIKSGDLHEAFYELNQKIKNSQKNG